MGLLSSLDAFHRRLAFAVFGRLGRWVAQHPLPVVLVGFLVSGLFGLGLISREIETEPSKLWVPEGVRSVEERQRFEALFGPFYRVTGLMSVARQPGADMLTNATLLELYGLQRAVLELEAEHPEEGGAPVRLHHICARVDPANNASQCLWTSPLDLWWSDALQDWDAQVIAASTHEQLAFRLQRGAVGPLGIKVDRQLVWGGIEFVNDNTNSTSDMGGGGEARVLSASAAWFTMLLNNTEAVVPLALAWERVYVDFMRNHTLLQHTANSFSAERSIEDELESELLTDIPLLFVSYAIMVVFVGFTIGHLHIVRSRILLGCLGIALLVCIILMALGFTSLVGIIFSPVSIQVLPFLLLGVGVNDMFILTTGFWDERHKRWKDGTWRSVPISESMYYAMAAVGPSSFLTSLADFVAFMLAAITNMPAVRAFCFQIAIAMIIETALVLTVFVGLIAIDAHRIEQGRLDVVPCVKVEACRKCDSDRSKNKCCRRLGQGRLLATFLHKYLAPVILHPVVRIVIIVLFLGFTGWGIYGTTRVDRGLGLLDAVPTSSYLVPYETNRTTYFANVGPPVYLVFPDIDYASWDVQDDLLRISIEYARNRWTLQDTELAWLKTYMFWTRISSHRSELIAVNRTLRIPPNKFYAWLPEFFDTQFGSAFAVDVNHKRHANGTGASITGSRFWWRSVGLNTTDHFTDSISSLRRISDASRYDTLRSFPYSVTFVFFEQYVTIGEQAILAIGVAAAAVFLVLLIFLANPLYALGGILFILQIIVCTVAVMWAWELDINPLSVVNLVMGVGFGVEFVAHTLRWFHISRLRKRVNRVRDTLKAIGAPVIMGALSTFLGIVILAGSRYPVFQLYYFRMYFLLVVIGMGFGVLFLPAVLSIGPQERKDTEEEQWSDWNPNDDFVPPAQYGKWDYEGRETEVELQAQVQEDHVMMNDFGAESKDE